MRIIDNVWQPSPSHSSVPYSAVVGYICSRYNWYWEQSTCKHCYKSLYCFSLPGQITISREPNNVTVTEGMDAFFACTYVGTSGVPSWRIANHVFAINALPPRHLFNGSGLIVSNVDMSMNMTSYSCLFSVYIGEGRFRTMESNSGFLFITGLHVSSSSYLVCLPNFPLVCGFNSRR